MVPGACPRGPGKGRRMKKHVSTIVLVIILIVGLCVLLYPSVSNYVNQRDASYAIDSYDASVSQLTDEQKNALSHRGNAVRNAGVLLEEIFGIRPKQRD